MIIAVTVSILLVMVERALVANDPLHARQG
jgi:hypothetical protein